MFLVFYIHYNFELISVIRYIESNYTAAHQDVHDIFVTLTSTGCNKLLVRKIKIIAWVGCSTYLNIYSSQENFQEFSKYGNYTTITKNIANVLKAINNEAKF